MGREERRDEALNRISEEALRCATGSSRADSLYTRVTTSVPCCKVKSERSLTREPSHCLLKNQVAGDYENLGKR